MHSNLFGRYVDYLQNNREDYSSMRYCDSFTSVPGICYKSEKVNHDTSSGGRISRNDSQFKRNGYLPSTKKITTTNSGTEEKWLLRKSSVSEQRIAVEASLVGEK